MFVVIGNSSYYPSPGVEDWVFTTERRQVAIECFTDYVAGEAGKEKYIGDDDIYLVIITSKGFEILREWHRWDMEVDDDDGSS